MKTFLIVIGVILIIGAVGALVMTIMDREVREVVISEIDLSKVPDGVYTGTFHSGRWNNVVEVTVQEHKIISIKNTNKLSDARAEEIVKKASEAMLAKQSVRIDAISGASLNTRSFQKAVENALTEGVAR